MRRTLSLAALAGLALGAISLSFVTDGWTQLGYLAGIRLQNTTPGTPDMGHMNVSGNAIFGGNVGIGTVTPVVKLDVRGGIGTNNVFGFTDVQQGASPFGVYMTAPALNSLSFHTFGLERMRVSPTGNVGINTTAPSQALHVNGNSFFSGSAKVGIGTQPLAPYGLSIFTGDNPNQLRLFRNGSFIIGIGSEDPPHLRLTGGDVGINIITVSPGFMLHVNGSAGKPGGGSWSNASDERLKKYIEPLTGSLERLLMLRGTTYEYIDPEAIHELPGQRIGMIAQEVERVFPDWVHETPNGYKAVTYRGFEALTVEALRDLRAEKDKQLAARDAKIASLRAELEELKSIVAALRGAMKVGK